MVILRPSVIPPLKRSMSVLPAMVRLPPDCRTTFPLDALAVATRVTPPKLRFREANKPIDTAERLTGIVMPIVRSPREDASNVSLVIKPPFSVICAVPAGGEALCWIVIVPRSASIVAPVSTMSLPGVLRVMLPPGPDAAGLKTESNRALPVSEMPVPVVRPLFNPIAPPLALRRPVPAPASL